jgi:glucose-6-phosphate 1-dehydrogenase
VSSSQVARSAVLVVFGGTGDLAHRKLYPAIGSLALRGELPRDFVVIGVSRTEMDDADFTASVTTTIAGTDRGDEKLAALAALGATFRWITGPFDDPATFTKLRDALADADAQHGTTGNRLYYMATIPQFFATVATGLGDAGLATQSDATFSRLVVEKPFGHDLASAHELNDALHSVFREEQIFRIDHYLAKDTVRNILALRFTNTVFEPIWNRRYVDHVQITVAESLGVEHRGTFYEQAGALRDIVQNHLMQVLALVAMEPPRSFAPGPIRDEKVKLLESVRPLDGDLQDTVVRAQYETGVLDGERVAGYRDEEGVNDHSKVETYLAMRLEIDNWRWAGVPFYLRTGKRLPNRATEVALRYKQVPFLPLPADAAQSLEPNELILRIQPDEGITLRFAAKVPGAGFQVRSAALDFNFDTAFAEKAPEAYERVLLEALLGDPTLFIREDEVLQAWRIVQPLIDAFTQGKVPLSFYPAGSWGPVEADELLENAHDQWRKPH